MVCVLEFANWPVAFVDSVNVMRNLWTHFCPCPDSEANLDVAVAVDTSYPVSLQINDYASSKTGGLLDTYEK